MASTVYLMVVLLSSLSVSRAAWKWVWEDDFNGPAGSPPDSKKWKHDLGNTNGWGNNELEYYTSSTKNAALDGKGNLLITARKNDAGHQYTSARLLTAGKFETTYGKIEARIKLPRGKGVWPAFWMLGNDINTSGWPKCGEIDIMEMRGSNPSVVLGTIHGPGYSGGGGLSGNYRSPDGRPFSDDFHVYTVEWYPDAIKWYVDGKWYQTRTPADTRGNPWVFKHPFFILLNLAVGGNFDGNPDGSVPFPQSMTVDYVKVFHQA